MLKPANDFDEIPIGGKKFDFSEFPEEGEKPKKPVKKPPARFAKKTEDTNKENG